ncbi:MULTISPECIES: TrkH family potassium uptake protein [Hyphobacterium]|uniref:Trk system potassium uptake protein n=1 Tax=Hyphobacterium vulgare TaxID=1736751 RepID=A0ABV6ZXM8_9PROT
MVRREAFEGMLRDFRVIFLTSGWLLAGMSVLALMHAIGSSLARDSEAGAFYATAVIGFVPAAVALAAGWGAKPELRFRQAVVITVMAWFGLPIFCALPFMLGTWQLSFVDAVFESVSGLTTTGSTVVSGLDDSPPSLLLWRSVLQWIGGVGIIALSIAILPFLKVGGMQLFKMESSDTSSERLIARPNQLAIAIGSIYLGLTLACMIGYRINGMTGFEALNHALTTVSTGGYSTSDSSLGHFSTGTHWVAIGFMAAGALPFLAYVRLTRQNMRTHGTGMGQIGLFFMIVAMAAGLMFVLRLIEDQSFATALREALFNVVSVITTTGYATADYQLWGPFAMAVFFFLTFVGGCAGSTSGGFKMFRFEVLAKALLQNLNRTAQPHSLSPARINGQPLGPGDVASVALFSAVYVATFAIGALVLSATGLDLMTSLSGSATALANVGPGLGAIIGPAGNFSGLPDSTKLVLGAIMVLGRLEVFTVLVLFVPRFHTA